MSIPATSNRDLLAGLDTLLADEDFGDDFLAPTAYAVVSARELLLAAYHARPDLADMRPAFSTIGDGDLFIRRRRGAREAWVLIPPTPDVPIRLYHAEGEAAGVDCPVTADRLATRLAWLRAAVE